MKHCDQAVYDLLDELEIRALPPSQEFMRCWIRRMYAELRERGMNDAQAYDMAFGQAAAILCRRSALESLPDAD